MHLAFSSDKVQSVSLGIILSKLGDHKTHYIVDPTHPVHQDTQVPHHTAITQVCSFHLCTESLPGCRWFFPSTQIWRSIFSGLWITWQSISSDPSVQSSSPSQTQDWGTQDPLEQINWSGLQLSWRASCCGRGSGAETRGKLFNN